MCSSNVRQRNVERNEKFRQFSCKILSQDLLIVDTVRNSVGDGIRKIYKGDVRLQLAKKKAGL